MYNPTMPRRVRYFFSLLSLALCAAAIALWVRSYWGTDYLQLSSPANSDGGIITHHTHGIAWTRGDMRLSYAEHTYFAHTAQPTSDGTGRSTWTWGRLGAGHMGCDPLPLNSMWNRLGFHTYQWGEASSFYDITEQGVALPAWLPVVIFGLLFCPWVIRRLRVRQRVAKGLCRTCGYDLCATPRRCPECGAAAPSGDTVIPIRGV
jgi:hypothetical protein